MAVFRDYWKQSEIDSEEVIAKLKQQNDLAQNAYKEAKKQVDMVHKEAKKQAVDKQAKKEADKARKKAFEQAKKDYNEAITE
jgi:vacuolar-type H+-ATPase subunit H